jgi:integrase
VQSKVQGAKRAQASDAMRTAELTKSLFLQAATIWLDDRKMFWSPRTYKDNKYYCDQLGKYFGEFKLTEITSDLIRAYQKMRRDQVYAGTINQELGCLVAMLKRIGRWADLAGDYQRLKMDRRSPGRALSEAEYERLTRHAMSRQEWTGAYLFMLLSTNTTAGPKELFTLQLKDYDRERKRIYVGRKEAKNVYRPRIIPLNEVAYAAMERVLELARKRGSHHPEHYLFPYRINGNAYGGVFDPTRHQTTVKTAWKKLTVAANLPGLRPYDCRHCAITNLLQNPDVSEETVKAIAGHVSPDILKTYSHIRLEAKQAALDALVRKSLKD